MKTMIYNSLTKNKAYLLLPGLLLMISCGGKSDKAAGKPAGMPQGANYVVVKDTSIREQIIITGNLQAEESIFVRPETSGQITDIYFKEGTTVKQGALILKINDQELRAQFERAEARQKLAQEQEYRQGVLLKKEAVSQQEYDIVFTELQSLKAETNLIKAQLAKTEVRAPFSGQLGLRMVSPGDYITPSTTITQLVKNDKIKISFSIPEKYAHTMKQNAEIFFTVNGIDKRYRANVYAMDPSIDENTRTLMVRAITNNDGNLIAGSFSKVELELKEIENTILIPNEAVIPILKGKKVFVSKNNVAQEVIIETGIRSDQFIQVTKGLSVGDTVITSGIMSVRNGSKLNLKKS